MAVSAVARPQGERPAAVSTPLDTPRLAPMGTGGNRCRIDRRGDNDMFHCLVDDETSFMPALQKTASAEEATGCFVLIEGEADVQPFRQT
jgi:hypothetical protein